MGLEYVLHVFAVSATLVVPGIFPPNFCRDDSVGVLLCCEGCNRRPLLGDLQSLMRRECVFPGFGLVFV